MYLCHGFGFTVDVVLQSGLVKMSVCFCS